MKYVYSLDDDQYFECSNIMNVRKIINIAMEENNIEDYVEDGFFQLYIAEKEELEESLNLVLKRFLKKYNLKPNNYLVKNKKCFLVRSDGKVYNETNCEDEEY